MRRPFWIQILLPFTAALLVAVALIATTSAWLALRRVETETMTDLHSLVETLNGSAVPYIEPVLRQMRGLSGADFVALDRESRIVSTTLPEQDRLPESRSNLPEGLHGESLSQLPRVTTPSGRSYFAIRIRADGAARVSTLLVLYPEAGWRNARWSAVWPPLAIGAVTFSLMAGIAVWLASRLGSRIRSVQGLLATIAAGEFPAITTPDSANDELDGLTMSAAALSGQLQDLQRRDREAERMRLLGQMAGGLAHQLRNAVTGARMAVQLHQRRCHTGRTDSTGTDDSLTVALHQLALTEQQMKGLLTLARREVSPRQTERLAMLLREIEQLVHPQAEHAHVELVVENQMPVQCRVRDAEAFRTAVLNLTLNALQAAGSGGHVRLLAATAFLADDKPHHSEQQLEQPPVEPATLLMTVSVLDDGPGPGPEVAQTLFDPFVTSRPEGVGLGLTLAQQSAAALGGTLAWHRLDGWTVFELTLSVDQPAD